MTKEIVSQMLPIDWTETKKILNKNDNLQFLENYLDKFEEIGYKYQNFEYLEGEELRETVFNQVSLLNSLKELGTKNNIEEKLIQELISSITKQLINCMQSMKNHKAIWAKYMNFVKLANEALAETKTKIKK